MIRVLIAEDQVMLRDAVALLLGLEDDIEVVGQVTSGLDVVRGVADSHADVALLDIELPGSSGLCAAEVLAVARPECAVVIVTTFGRPGYLRRALAAGVRGFVLKDGPVDRLADTIRRVVEGETVIDPGLAELDSGLGTSPLTGREVDVLAVAADGSTVADISRRLHLGEHTVRNYLSAAIGKTGTRNRVEAALLARDNGWLDP